VHDRERDEQQHARNGEERNGARVGLIVALRFGAGRVVVVCVIGSQTWARV
jgi:hypothetical protein